MKREYPEINKYIRKGGDAEIKGDLCISICICTYKRTNYLADLLEELGRQIDQNFNHEIEIIVVDNDKESSAREVVNKIIHKTTCLVRYINEPKKNISLARNRAINNARGSIIIFIDDDETPDGLWLNNIINFYIKNRCDGVLGPVKTRFEHPPPEWIIKSRIMQRDDPPSGTRLQIRGMRTGNLLIRKDILVGKNNYFDERFGLIGGEDIDLFSRLAAQGHVFLWCHEAVVYERITKERLHINYHLRRALSRGLAQSKMTPLASIYTIKSMFAIILYYFLLPFLLLKGFYLFNLYLVKFFDHIGKMLGYININPVSHYKD